MYGTIPFPGNVAGKFDNGNAPAGLRGTFLDAAWFQQINDELNYVLALGSIGPDPTQPYQVGQALLSIIANRANQLVSHSFTFTSPAGGCISGQSLLVGDLFGVVSIGASAGLPATMFVLGVRTVAKLPGEAWNQQGAALWWDDVAKVCRLTPSSGLRLVGAVAETAASGANTGSARLNGCAASPYP